MRIVPSCEQCLYERQKHVASKIQDKEARNNYLAEIREALANRKEDDSAPYMVYLFKKILKRYCNDADIYPNIKDEYNSLMLSMEAAIEEKIRASEDPLETSIIYARIGNYIDFGAMNHVEKDVLLRMLEEESREGLCKETYEAFCEECTKGKNFLLLCDNCGEIVLDKLFIRQLKKRFPQLSVYAMVRGEAVLNDATMEDAVFCGMDKEAILISNGNGVAGTVVDLLSPQAKEVLEAADVILSKGQGNYESFSGYKGTVFYSFLCKCELFTSRFKVPRLTGMFVREEGRKNGSIPIPTHLRDILHVDEERFDGHNMDGRLKCTCGCDDIKLKVYAEAYLEHIAVKRCKDNYGFRIVGSCAVCRKGFDVFDMAKHGYNGFVCHDGISAEDADLKEFLCSKCQGDTFAVDIGIELEDKEQFLEEVVEYEPDTFVPEDYVNAFDWFTVSLKCRRCGRKYNNWVNFETS